MKYKTTKRDVLQAYGSRNVISVGYCNLQTLLRYEDAEAYTAGTAGWNADVYDFGETAIVTGYHPFGGIVPAYDMVRKYEEEASNLMADSIIEGEGFTERRAAMRNLIDRFICEACGKED